MAVDRKRQRLLNAAFSFAPQSQLRRLIGVQGVADRDADASNVIGIELNVVVDQVKMGLGPDKEAAPKIVTDSTPDVDHEMIAARVAEAT